MILVYPDAEDWRRIQAITGDASWAPGKMRAYFKRIENCRHRPVLRLLSRIGIDFSGHGWNGWLTTEQAKPRQAFDAQIFRLLADSAQAAMLHAPRALAALVRMVLGQADPNDRTQAIGRATKVWYTPMTTDGHRRTGARERVLEAQETAPRSGGRLQVQTHTLAVRVLLDEAQRAVGVECRAGPGLYRATPDPATSPGAPQRFCARREVILAGGAFNTPQLLMLSGIGPTETLAAHGIPLRVDLPGVGRNLQDRYEVGVVNRMTEDWTALNGARFETGDPLWRAWSTDRSGLYVSNGAVLAAAKRSVSGKTGPRDLFFMALLAPFGGYFPGYSKEIAGRHDYLTWTVLKSHTTNRGGVVTLRSADPLDPPLINFHSFEEGDGDPRADLEAVVDGVEFARRMAKPLHADGLIAAEEEPGPAVRTRAEIAQYVRDRAWGHHASCSCAIGPREAGGVVDGDFRVHGTSGLRIVDASVFPRIPGSFIACAVYMIAEKAADAIHRTATEGRAT
jgi:choline dehydrogenase-like flavoprotein